MDQGHYHQFGQQTFAAVPCCICETPVDPPNSANMCVVCIRKQIDITEGIPKNVTVQWCKGCGRFLEPPNKWLTAQLESKELLSFCLKRLKGLNKVKLIDASFVWTEPHSKRIKVMLVVQQEVFNSTILQQSFIVEYVVANLFCPDCHKSEAGGEENAWVSVAQVRQKVNHKRTFFWLEQVILRNLASLNTTFIKEEPDGLDFYFNNNSHCSNFVDFLQSMVPLRYKTAKQLVNHDANNNVYNYKHAWSIEIPPICRDDLVCLPARTAMALGNIHPVALVYKVSNNIHIIDPFTMQTREISANMYWADPFRSIGTKLNLSEFFVLDSEPTGQSVSKFMQSDVTVARMSDFGRNDNVYYVHSHLGHLLNAGDTVLGYDLSTANLNDSDLAGLRGRDMPDMVLVKKHYPGRNKKKNRAWKLKALAKEREEKRKHEKEREAADYEEFLQEVEENEDMQGQINLYRDPTAKGREVDDMEDDAEVAFPEVNVDLLLEDFENMHL